MSEALLDTEFLESLNSQKNRETYAKIIALNFKEEPQEEITGKISSGGSINIDGNSAIRRSCSLSMVAEDVNINDFYWGLNTKVEIYIGLKNNIDSRYEDIIWFKQGIFVLNSFSCSFNVSSYSISLSGQDKMCLLNGSIGGGLTALSTDFGTYDEIDEDGNILNYSYPIKEIIKEAVHHYAGEPYHKILVNDLDDDALSLMEYRGDTDMYMLIDSMSTDVTNIRFDDDTIEDAIYYLDADLTSEITLNNIPVYDGRITEFNYEENDDLPATLIYDEEGNTYTVAKITYGDACGYEFAELTYAGDLIVDVDGNICTGVLDKIVEMLGDYEYFYDIDGFFHFQKKKIYLNTSWNNIVNGEDEDYVENAAMTSSSVYSFTDSQLISSFSNQPDFANVRNDFAIWGYKNSSTDTDVPIHLRYAIDKKPEYYKAFDGTVYATSKYKGADAPEQTYDWRELIYQMAADYFKYQHEDNFLSTLGRLNLDYYPSGITGYEQYYTDMQGFWRTLYDPSCVDTEQVDYESGDSYYAWDSDTNTFTEYDYDQVTEIIPIEEDKEVYYYNGEVTLDDIITQVAKDKATSKGDDEIKELFLESWKNELDNYKSVNYNEDNYFIETAFDLDIDQFSQELQKERNVIKFLFSTLIQRGSRTYPVPKALASLVSKTGTYSTQLSDGNSKQIYEQLKTFYAGRKNFCINEAIKDVSEIKDIILKLENFQANYINFLLNKYDKIISEQIQSEISNINNIINTVITELKSIMKTLNSNPLLVLDAEDTYLKEISNLYDIFVEYEEYSQLINSLKLTQEFLSKNSGENEDELSQLAESYLFKDDNLPFVFTNNLTNIESSLITTNDISSELFDNSNEKYIQLKEKLNNLLTYTNYLNDVYNKDKEVKENLINNLDYSSNYIKSLIFSNLDYDIIASDEISLSYADNRTKEQKASDLAIEEAGGDFELFQAARKNIRRINKNKIKYGKNQNDGTWKVMKKKKKVNAMSFITSTLVLAGVEKKALSFTCKKGVLGGTDASYIKKNYTVKQKLNKTIASLVKDKTLLPGDIVTAASSSHIMIYIGKSSNGKYHFYSLGKNFTFDNVVGTYRPKDYKIGMIIRPKKVLWALTRINTVTPTLTITKQSLNTSTNIRTLDNTIALENIFYKQFFNDKVKNRIDYCLGILNICQYYSELIDKYSDNSWDLNKDKFLEIKTVDDNGVTQIDYDLANLLVSMYYPNYYWKSDGVWDEYVPYEVYSDEETYYSYEKYKIIPTIDTSQIYYVLNEETGKYEVYEPEVFQILSSTGDEVIYEVYGFKSGYKYYIKNDNKIFETDQIITKPTTSSLSYYTTHYFLDTSEDLNRWGTFCEKTVSDINPSLIYFEKGTEENPYILCDISAAARLGAEEGYLKEFTLPVNIIYYTIVDDEESEVSSFERGITYYYYDNNNDKVSFQFNEDTVYYILPEEPKLVIDLSDYNEELDYYHSDLIVNKNNDNSIDFNSDYTYYYYNIVTLDNIINMDYYYIKNNDEYEEVRILTEYERGTKYYEKSYDYQLADSYDSASVYYKKEITSETDDDGEETEVINYINVIDLVETYREEDSDVFSTEIIEDIYHQTGIKIYDDGEIYDIDFSIQEYYTKDKLVFVAIDYYNVVFYERAETFEEGTQYYTQYYSQYKKISITSQEEFDENSPLYVILNTDKELELYPSDEFNIDTYWTMSLMEPEDLVFWFDFLDMESGEFAHYAVPTIGDRPKSVKDETVKSIYYRDVPTVIFSGKDGIYIKVFMNQEAFNNPNYLVTLEEDDEGNTILDDDGNPTVVSIEREVVFYEKDDDGQYIEATKYTANKDYYRLMTPEDRRSGYTYITVNDSIENLFSISSQGKSTFDVLNEYLYNNVYCAESITLNAIPIYYLEPNTRIFVQDTQSGIEGEYVISTISIPLTYNGQMSINATKAVSRII